MTWLYPSWTPQKSSRRGFNTWDLFYSKWGNITVGTGNGFFPDSSSSVDSGVRLSNYHGIAIGSRSTVDRVFVETQLVTDLQATPGLIPLWVDGRRIIDFQTCNIGQPLRGNILGPVTIYNAEQYTTATTYIPDDGAYVPVPLVSNLFEEPELHLVFLQRKQDVSLLNGPRMPMQRVYGGTNVVDLTEQLIRILPIGGRKGLTFQATVSAGTVNFRVGIIGANIGTGANPLIEQTLATVIGVSATSAPAFIDITGRAQYLTLYATVTDDDGGAGADYDLELTITDDCCGEAVVESGGTNPPAVLGGPGDSSCLIYQPGGGQAGPGTFASWTDLMAQLAAYRAANNGGGCYTIAFDDSIVSPAVIPAGAYDMTGCIWEGDQAGFGAFVNIADGASFTGLRQFRNNLAVMNLNTVTSPISDVVDGEIVLIGNFTDLSTVAGGVPFFDGTGVAAAGTLYVQMQGSSNLGFYDTGAVIDMPTAGSFLTILAVDLSTPIATSLTGAVGAILIMQVDTLANAPSVWPGWGGTVRAPTLIVAPSLVPNPYLAAPSAVPIAADFNLWMRLNASGGAISQPLPTISAAAGEFSHPGCMLMVSEEGGGAFDVTITPGAGDTIEGGASYTIHPRSTVILMSDGISDWRVVGERMANRRLAPPEQWSQENIAASQTDVVMSAAVSVNFDEIKMIRAGSIVGMSTRLTETCTAGTLTVKVSKNGAAGTLSVVTTNASNTTGGQSTQAAGVDTFVAGDRLGMLLTSTVGWLPVTSDIEAWLEIEES